MNTKNNFAGFKNQATMELANKLLSKPELVAKAILFMQNRKKHNSFRRFFLLVANISLNELPHDIVFDELDEMMLSLTNGQSDNPK